MFGSYRHELLGAHLRDLEESTQRERAERLKALKRAIAETQTKNKRLIRTLEISDEIDQELVRGINERQAQLRAEREDLEHQLAEAEDELHRAPNPELLHRLPMGQLPDELSRRLFEALRLEIHYHHDSPLPGHPHRRDHRRRGTGHPDSQRRTPTYAQDRKRRGGTRYEPATCTSRRRC